MKFFVYVLENANGVFYIGSTNNLERRIVQHNDVTRHAWASRRGPWVLKCFREFETRSEAMQEERLLKLIKNRNMVLSTTAGWRRGTSGGS